MRTEIIHCDMCGNNTSINNLERPVIDIDVKIRMNFKTTDLTGSTKQMDMCHDCRKLIWELIYISQHNQDKRVEFILEDN